MNVTRDLRDTITDQSMAQELDLVSEGPETFVSDFVDEVSYEFYEFFGFEKRIQNFNQELKIFERKSKDSFYFSILYVTYYHLIERKEDFDFCQDEEKLCQVLGQDFFEKLKSKKESLQPDLSLYTFEAHCHVVNDLLMEKKIFLRVYEFRKKFRYLIKKMSKGKNTPQRDLSACVEERFNSFQLVKKLTEKLTKQNYKPINIVYKPVSKINQINCFFTTSIRNAYRVVSGKNNVSTTADQCFICNKFLLKENL